VALVGVKDLIIVETKDALLICKRGQSQDVKKIVDALEAKKIHQLL
jgi:mannose-1-phosphate guanylyltransferase